MLGVAHAVLLPIARRPATQSLRVLSSQMFDSGRIRAIAARRFFQATQACFGSDAPRMRLLGVVLALPFESQQTQQWYQRESLDNESAEDDAEREKDDEIARREGLVHDGDERQSEREHERIAASHAGPRHERRFGPWRSHLFPPLAADVSQYRRGREGICHARHDGGEGDERAVANQQAERVVAERANHYGQLETDHTEDKALEEELHHDP